MWWPAWGWAGSASWRAFPAICGRCGTFWTGQPLISVCCCGPVVRGREIGSATSFTVTCARPISWPANFLRGPSCWNSGPSSSKLGPPKWPIGPGKLTLAVGPPRIAKEKSGWSSSFGIWCSRLKPPRKSWPCLSAFWTAGGLFIKRPVGSWPKEICV